MDKNGLGVLYKAAPEGHVVRLCLGHHAGGPHHHHRKGIEEGGVGRHRQNLGLLGTRLLADDFYAMKAANKKLQGIIILNENNG